MKTVHEDDKPVVFTYLYQQPARYTFEQPKLKTWCESNCKGLVLNLFAGKVRLNVSEYRVDISDEFEPDVVMDAQLFVETTGMKFDTVVFDPPYNWRKSREKYGDGRYIGNEKKLKDALPRILNNGCVVISFGYDSVAMSRSRGFEKVALCLVCHSGNHHDTICVAERKVGVDNIEHTLINAGLLNVGVI